MGPTLNLDAYFDRIGYSGRPAPGLITLRELHRLHPQAIAFDGLSPFIGEPVSLDIGSLEQKLISGSRGGYCYEHNLLFAHVLQTLGFRVTGVAGRVRLHWPLEAITPRSHMVLLVTLPEGLYIADVGFGKLTLTAPVRLEIGLEQSTPHERVRITEAASGTYALQASLDSDWKTLYVFDTQEAYLPDYEMFNWYFSSHPKSPFVNGIMMGRPEPGKRHALLNTRYSMQEANGRSDIQNLTSIEQIREILAKAFGVELPAGPKVESKLMALLNS